LNLINSNQKLHKRKPCDFILNDSGDGLFASLMPTSQSRVHRKWLNFDGRCTPTCRVTWEYYLRLFIPGFFERSTGSEGGVGYVPSSTNNKETLPTSWNHLINPILTLFFSLSVENDDGESDITNIKKEKKHSFYVNWLII